MTAVAVGLFAVLAVLLWPPERGRPWRPAASPSLMGPASVPGTGWTRQRGRRRALDDAVADLLAVLAAPLRAGATPLSALVAAAAGFADDGPVGDLVAELVQAGREGGALSCVWATHAEDLDSAALRFVGSAWSVSETTGAPLADALTCAEAVLRERRRSAERLRSAVAGPRASMTVLALLPLSGPLVGLACGVGPVQLYVSHPVGAVSLVVGAVWGALAWLWARRIVRGAS